MQFQNAYSAYKYLYNAIKDSVTTVNRSPIQLQSLDNLSDSYCTHFIDIIVNGNISRVKIIDFTFPKAGHQYYKMKIHILFVLLLLLLVLKMIV